MSDKIEAIRERHAVYPPRPGAPHGFFIAHQDIATLLAEVDKLGAENEKLRAEIERLRADNERMHNVLYRIARKRPFVHNPWALARAEVEGKP